MSTAWWKVDMIIVKKWQKIYSLERSLSSKMSFLQLFSVWAGCFFCWSCSISNWYKRVVTGLQSRASNGSSLHKGLVTRCDRQSWTLKLVTFIKCLLCCWLSVSGWCNYESGSSINGSLTELNSSPVYDQRKCYSVTYRAGREQFDRVQIICCETGRLGTRNCCVF